MYLICITIASFYCLRIRVLNIIFTLYVWFACEIHYITILLLLEQFMYFVARCHLMLILSLICGGVLDGLCKAFTLKVFVSLIHAQIIKWVNKKINKLLCAEIKIFLIWTFIYLEAVSLWHLLYSVLFCWLSLDCNVCNFRG